MRRLLSILLAFATLLPFAAPAFALGDGGAAARLPACCRRTGVHHCMLEHPSEQVQVGMVCVQYPQPSAAVVLHGDVAATVAACVLQSAQSHAAVCASERPAAKSAAIDSVSSRGPPHLLS